MVEDEFGRPVPPKGKLHKGVVLQSHKQPSTIPAKNELLGPPKSHIHSSSSSSFSSSSPSSSPKGGFSVGSRRADPFTVTREQELTPGPGSYSSSSPSLSSQQLSDLSANKKGSGNGFVSTTNRFPEVSPASKNAPAPGQYYNSNNDSSIRLSGPKIVPNYSEELPEAEPTPGPGCYDPHTINYPQPNNKGSSSFISSDKRTKFLPEGGDKHERRMGPGKYDYKDERGKEVKVSSPFKSKTQKGIKFETSSTPGPGAYRHEQKSPPSKPAKVGMSPQGRIQTSSMPSSETTINNNFNNKPSLGPGEYLPVYPSPPPLSHPSPSAPPRIRAKSTPVALGSSFASTSQRIQLFTPSSSSPSLGPGEYYSETPLDKPSFHANRREKWV